jgi:transcriptional regulator with XRE-family HTH domain
VQQHFSPDRLRQQRKRAGFNRDRLAFVIGRTTQTVTNYETGRQTPTTAVLGSIADALGIAAGDLFEPTIRDHARAVADQAPDLSSQQRDRLTGLLGSAAERNREAA